MGLSNFFNNSAGFGSFPNTSGQAVVEEKESLSVYSSSKDVLFQQSTVLLSTLVVILVFVTLIISDNSPGIFSSEKAIINKISVEIDNTNIPVDANRKQDMLNDAKLANDSLTSGDVDTAREALLRLKNNVRQISVHSDALIIPKDLKAQHDPNGEYTEGDLVINNDFLDDYLAIVDILVKIES